MMNVMIAPFALFFGLLWKFAPVDALPVEPPPTAGIVSVSHPAALPAPRDLPENLCALFVAEYPQGALPAPFEMEFTDVLNKRTSLTLAATVNPENRPDGVLVFLEGQFNAPDVMKRLAEKMNENPQITIGQSPLGPTLTLTQVPEAGRVRSPFQAFAFSLMLEAVSPTTLRLSSFSVRESLRAGKTLAPESAFAALLVPDKATPRRALVTPFNTMLNAAVDSLAKDAGNLEEAAQIKQAILKPLLGVASIRGAGRVVSADAVSSSLVFETASPEAAQELQEFFFGYKMMINTLLTAEAPKDFPDVLKTLLSGIKITVDGSSTTMSARITAEQSKAVTGFFMPKANPSEETGGVARGGGMEVLLFLWL